MDNRYDAVVVGSGPNGLSAAITLAEKGLKVIIIEKADTIGGGMRTAELTLPGFKHDICSAIHPLGVASPFFRNLPLQEHGLEWIYPPMGLVHPFHDGSAAMLFKSVDATAQSLGRDNGAYRTLMHPQVKNWDKIVKDVLGPLRIPTHPLALIRFGLRAMQSARGFAYRTFEGREARALFAGLAAHSIVPLKRPFTAAFGLVMGILGHSAGWPMPKGGSQMIANSMASYFKSLGGEIITSWGVTSLEELPKSKAVLLDITPRQLIAIAGDKLGKIYRWQLNKFRYGPGVFKVDFALDGPVPWINEQWSGAGVLHLGGTIEEVLHSENQVWFGTHPEKPFILAAQQSMFDPTRAPNGKHTLWAYCHVPHGSIVDMTGRIENVIESFAPGFKEKILAKFRMSSIDFQKHNPNYVGGDINGGIQDWRQLFTRPVISFSPYYTSIKGVYLCSSSTPPGGGVHGMCGYHSARNVLKSIFGLAPKEMN